MAHASHSHTSNDEGVVPVAEPAVARALWATVAVLVVSALVAVAVMWPSRAGIGADAELASRPVHATVQAVAVGPCPSDPSASCRTVSGSVTEGDRAGEVFALEFGVGGVGKQPQPGDSILVTAFETIDGTTIYNFYDYERGAPLVWLTIAFVAAVIALGRWRGIGAVAGLAVSIVVIVVFLIPAILEGANAVLVALVAALLIAIVALFLSHGVNVATAVALLSSFAAMALTVLLAHLFMRVGQLTGFTDENTQVLAALAAPIDPRGLLLAGVLIGSLGVLDDVTVTQVSVVWELRKLHPDAPWRWVHRRAVRVGRDHISSTVNTLFLAYAGASLSLMLVFAQTGRSLVTVVTSEVVAVEVVRALVGSIGLVASVPISTALASAILRSPATQVEPALSTVPTG